MHALLEAASLFRAETFPLWAVTWRIYPVLLENEGSLKGSLKYEGFVVTLRHAAYAS